jgi:TetR/AcrR family transcriptional regulator, regulator of autoinduction and epiphytic fitness
MSATPVEQITSDGRHVRRLKNRDAVVEALLALYREGNLQPSTDEIAERAGLSPRSLFRYFDDVDDLVRAAINRQHEHLDRRAQLRLDPALPLHERIDLLVEHRLQLFDAMSFVGMVARLRAPFQPIVAHELAEARAYLRNQLRTAFAPELQAMDAGERAATLAAIDVLCSYESYHLMRDDQGLSRPKAAVAIVVSLRRLLTESETT